MYNLVILLNHFVETTGLPVILLYDSGEIRYFTKERIEGLPNMTFWDRIAIAPGASGQLVSDEFLFFGKTVPAEGGCQILVGPCVDAPCTLEKARHILRTLSMPLSDAEGLRRRLNGLRFYAYQDFVAQMRFLQYLVNETGGLTQITWGNTPGGAAADAAGDAFPNGGNEEYERALLRVIEYGRLDEARAAAKQDAFAHTRLGPVASDTLRAYRDVLIVSATLFSRAAVRGGCAYEAMLALTDGYLQRVERVDTYNGFWTLWTEMLEEFTRRVHDLALREGASALEKRVAAYVSAHLYDEKLSVGTMADDLHLSRSHLSRRFSAESGQRLAEYIRRMKIQEAKRLLLEGKQSHAEIAHALGFSSMSYFYMAFRKVTGETPSEFLSLSQYGG